MRALPDMISHFLSSRKSASASASQPPVPDSATEESHTRHLLYPDAHTLYHPDNQPYPLHSAPLTPGSSHDGPLPEIDLEYPRDCRIIIAQDENGGMPKCILYDSKATHARADSPVLPSARARAFGPGVTAINASTAGPTFGGIHARRSSLATPPTVPKSPTMGGFTRIRTRGGSVSSMPNIDEHATVQAKAQAKAKESTDLANVCLDCMFGNLPMGYRGNSNKIHIVPLDTRPADSPPLNIGPHEATGSLGRAEGLRRRSNLAKSFTPANPPTDLPRSDSNDSIVKESKRRTIFITRMFSVNIPEEESDERTPTPQSSLPKGNGFPFPATTNKPGASKAHYASQARKAPMYAITIILHLPISHTSPTLRPPSRGGNLRGAAHLSTSFPGQDSLGSSLDSDRRAGWAFIEPNFGVESLLSSSMNSDVDDRVDVVAQHWDVIMRALTSLQHVVQERILAHFKAPDAKSPPLIPQHRHQASRSSLRDVSGQPSRRPFRLQSNALMMDRDIQSAAESTGNRVVTGMRIPRVVTGQGKWGVWREEARWLSGWTRKEQNFFFFNLLTAFLGNHTEWLNVLGPKWHRKRHREQQKATAGENLTIPNRTVIVSPDKIAARRLIFLLAAFLPPSTSAVCEGSSHIRPGTGASFRAYSQSPPTNMPPSRKQSLRRQINRRPKGKQSMTNMHLQPPTASNGHQPSIDIANERRELAAIDMPDAKRPPAHSRRSSAHSIRTSLVLPVIADGASAGKSSIATTSTATPLNTVPVAYFTLPRTKSSGPTPDYRPDSSDSVASANLVHTLQRSGTGQTSIASNDSSNNSRWSGFMNFLSGRRASSTDQSDYLQTTDDGIGYRGQERPVSQLEQMVHELSMDGMFGEGDMHERRLADTDAATSGSPDIFPLSCSSGVPASAARPIPERPRTFDSQLKLSVNEKDGVIDVDIPLPDFGSPLQSPLLGGYGSASSQHGSSYGESSILSVPYCEPEQPVNAAGWLGQFHPDFAIQAIKPYKELEADIKKAMSAEPTPLGSVTTPSLESGPLERWVDVCSALVADTRSFKIKRIRLRRLVKLIPTPTYQPSAMTPGVGGVPPGRSQYGNPYTTGSAVPMMTEVHLSEDFIDEDIMDFDATLVDGVDRALAHSGETTRVNSAQSSRSNSRRGRRDKRAESEATPHVEVPQADCKGVIFDALESVVKDVTAARNPKDESKRPNDTLKSAKTVHPRTAADSSLKEGIRRWLVEVE